MHIYTGDDIEPELQSSLLPESLLEELNFMGEGIWNFSGKDTEWRSTDYCQPTTSTSVSTVATSTTTSSITTATATSTTVTSSVASATMSRTTTSMSTATTAAQPGAAIVPAATATQATKTTPQVSSTKLEQYKKVADSNDARSLYTLFPEDPLEGTLSPCGDLSALLRGNDTASRKQWKNQDQTEEVKKNPYAMMKLGNFLSIMISFAVILLCYFVTHIVTPLRMALGGRVRISSTFSIDTTTTAAHKPTPLSLTDEPDKEGNSDKEKWTKPPPSPFSYYFHEWPGDDKNSNSEVDTDLAWWHRTPSGDETDFEKKDKLNSSSSSSYDSGSFDSGAFSSDSSSSVSFSSFSSDASSSLSSLSCSPLVSPLPSTSLCRVWSRELSIQDEEPPEPFLLLESLINGFYFTKKKESSLIKLLSSSRKPAPSYQQRVPLPVDEPKDGSRWNSPEAFSKLNPLAKEFAVDNTKSNPDVSATEFHDSGMEELFGYDYEDENMVIYEEEPQSVVDEDTPSPPSTPQHKKKKKKKKKKKSTAPRHTKWMTIFPDNGPLARKNAATSSESSEDSEQFDEIITKGSMEDGRNEKGTGHGEKRLVIPPGRPGVPVEAQPTGPHSQRKRPMVRYMWYNVVTCDAHNGYIHHQYLMQTDIVSTEPYCCIRYPAAVPYYLSTDPRVSEPMGIPYSVVPAVPAVEYPKSGLKTMDATPFAISSQ